VEVQKEIKTINEKGAAVLVLSFAEAERLGAHSADLKIDLQIASDVERNAYRAYGLQAGSITAVWHPKVLWKYVAHLARGKMPTPPTAGDDLSQLGGDFVIGPDGRFTYIFLSKRPDQRPGVTELMAHLPS
jgi:hypothetical protein